MLNTGGVSAAPIRTRQRIAGGNPEMFIWDDIEGYLNSFCAEPSFSLDVPASTVQASSPGELACYCGCDSGVLSYEVDLRDKLRDLFGVYCL
ncbi:hypothetical protein GWI33_007460 [Rhynchophorus ferrugineus]|uniref:Uncharacterized protein n=1 Tax=Rhynchophorus ferrugineus TaxID=354439 RepID=A0A834IJU8_RHYFE|nr:hypothetical protein GWI33_007460 [Rhynchophorus ferrugineus]